MTSLIVIACLIKSRETIGSSWRDLRQVRDKLCESISLVTGHIHEIVTALRALRSEQKTFCGGMITQRRKE
jgi:hypothetical protein